MADKKKKGKKKTAAKDNGRTYLKPGTVMGCSGYTDLRITKPKGKNGECGLELHGTEGGELDYYIENGDVHHAVYLDLDGTPKTNKHYGQYYYEA